MINRIKNIINLTKIFFQDSFQYTNIVNKKTNKLNKSSIKIWLMIIIMTAITYLSYILIKNLDLINYPSIFLNAFFFILMTVLIFQVILICMNVYYFSKDMELILPLPIKPIDLLIAKVNTIIINTYFLEMVFILFPLIIYGIYISAGILFYIYALIILVIFPILPILVISIIMMFLMKLSKFVKNKDIFQVIITLLFIALVFFAEFKVIKNVINQNNYEINYEENEAVNELNIFNNKLEKINKIFVETNHFSYILNNSNEIVSVIKLLEIIALDIVFFIIFIFIGKITYLKNILKNNNFNATKKISEINLNKKCRKKYKGISYVITDFKLIFKNPIFFIQCVFPTLIIIITLLIILMFAIPNIRNLLNSTLFQEQMIEFDFKTICAILIGIQVILTFSNLSITSISRQGKNAIYMKILPVDYYKQIIYKSIPQIIINAVFILTLLIVINAVIPNIKFLYYLYIFIIANLLSIFNSILMVILDLNEPNLEWSAEYQVVSQNNKKIYQYAMTIIVILLLTYFAKIFVDYSIHLSCIFMICLLIIILLIFNIIIFKNKIKLFEKIN